MVENTNDPVSKMSHRWRGVGANAVSDNAEYRYVPGFTEFGVFGGMMDYTLYHYLLGEDYEPTPKELKFIQFVLFGSMRLAARNALDRDMRACVEWLGLNPCVDLSEDSIIHLSGNRRWLTDLNGMNDGSWEEEVADVDRQDAAVNTEEIYVISVETERMDASVGTDEVVVDRRDVAVSTVKTKRKHKSVETDVVVVDNQNAAVNTVETERVDASVGTDEVVADCAQGLDMDTGTGNGMPVGSALAADADCDTVVANGVDPLSDSDASQATSTSTVSQGKVRAGKSGSSSISKRPTWRNGRWVEPISSDSHTHKTHHRSKEPRHGSRYRSRPGYDSGHGSGYQSGCYTGYGSGYHSGYGSGYHSGYGSDGSGSGGGCARKRGSCFNCGKDGHWRRECRGYAKHQGRGISDGGVSGMERVQHFALQMIMELQRHGVQLDFQPVDYGPKPSIKTFGTGRGWRSLGPLG
eukprot:TRINITY_DN2916_c0_g1::TRINITY_DN2916_c0_g1_i2::g.4272::m.4272 TRINITY_DN2916_c0_g1::TRINITY_DN2916_c0_g1_i2::g.4272  ORF type:complete len:466 (-),score=29.35,zf-CCHC/PF00098.18/3e-05,SBP_bac_3/PF00497.15/0.034,zf-CCHC_3/PF13917.1/0.17,zf-CCHC_5/PF14787.1/0.38 TRINITY_DN2916_c0_g1_i2:695-2092(-)